MSLLKVNTVSDVLGTHQGNVADLVQGAAKAWVAFNGTGTVAILSAYNVISITDNGLGIYTVNTANALQDANYALAVSLDLAATRATIRPTLFTNTSVRLTCTGGAGDSAADAAYVSVAFFR